MRHASTIKSRPKRRIAVRIEPVPRRRWPSWLKQERIMTALRRMPILAL